MEQWEVKIAETVFRGANSMGYVVSLIFHCWSLTGYLPSEFFGHLQVHQIS